MPGMPNSLACRACHNLGHAGHAVVIKQRHRGDDLLGDCKNGLTPFNEYLIGFPFHIANKMELIEIIKNRDRDYFHCIIKCIYVP